MDVRPLHDLNVLEADDDITKRVHVLATERLVGVLVGEHVLAFFCKFDRVSAV